MNATPSVNPPSASESKKIGTLPKNFESKPLPTSGQNPSSLAFSSVLLSFAQFHARFLERFHKGFETFPSAECTFSRQIGQQLGGRIYKYFLEQIVPKRNTEITACRACVIFPLVGDAQSWPVVEWQEGSNTDVIAMFHVENEEEPEPFSWILHSITISGQQESRSNRNTFFWRVTDLPILNTLFRVAQHALGILSWSTADANKLYCEQTDKEKKDFSINEYTQATSST